MNGDGKPSELKTESTREPTLAGINHKINSLSTDLLLLRRSVEKANRGIDDILRKMERRD